MTQNPKCSEQLDIFTYHAMYKTNIQKESEPIQSIFERFAYFLNFKIFEFVYLRNNCFMNYEIFSFKF